MPDTEKIIDLLDKYTSDKISPEERTELFRYVASGNFDQLVLQHIEKNLRAGKIGGTNLSPGRSADIMHKILSSERQNSLLIPKRSFKKKLIFWSIAAAFIGAIAFSVYLFNSDKNNKLFSNMILAKNMTEKENSSHLPLKIKLEEGSVITLQPGSAIRYPAHFLPGKREIYLDGEAYFEVSKNAKRPFFVYNNNIVAHVLGKSFNVKMNHESRQLEVSVRSGRVEVYEDKSNGKKNNGVILLPNQKVIYNQATRQFVPSLVDVPLPVADESAADQKPSENFVFEGTPLKTVISSLEKTYGIEIMVENENINRCLFTGDVSRQDLYTRLDIICKSIQASYEVEETKILIKGTGCN
jgi:transmembrane sensor